MTKELRKLKHDSKMEIQKKLLAFCKFKIIQSKKRSWTIAYIQVGEVLYYGASIEVKICVNYYPGRMKTIALGRLSRCPVVTLAQPIKDAHWHTLIYLQGLKGRLRIPPERWWKILIPLRIHLRVMK